MPLERIIITFRKNGEFRGASATDFDGQPSHLDPPALAAAVATINAAAVARLAVVDAEIAAKDAALTAIETAIDDPKLDDKATLEVAKVVVVERKLTAKQRELAGLRAEKIAIQEKIDALTPKA